MKKKILLSGSVAMLLALPVMSFADNGDGQNNGASLVSGSTLQDLSAAQTKVALLKEQLEIAKLQAEIAKAKKGDLGNSTATSQMPGMTPDRSQPYPTMQPLPAVSKPQVALPKVIDVLGVPGRYQANLAMPEGGTLAVESGSVLGSSMRVLSVSPSGVEILHENKKVLLPFESADLGSSSSGTSFGGRSPIPQPMNGVLPAEPLGSPTGIPGPGNAIPPGMPVSPSMMH